MDYSLYFPQPISYYLLGGAALTAFVVLAVIPRRHAPEETAFEGAFLLSALAALFTCRWPVFSWTDPINPDEGALVACGMKAMFDWIPWRGFDPGYQRAPEL